MPELRPLTEYQWGVYSSAGDLIDACTSRADARLARREREREAMHREKFYVNMMEVLYRPISGRSGRG